LRWLSISFSIALRFGYLVEKASSRLLYGELRESSLPRRIASDVTGILQENIVLLSRLNVIRSNTIKGVLFMLFAGAAA
jgi:hypothetical protein